MPKDDKVGMRKEYSFAGGRRGRYAARFTPEERDTLVRRSALHDAQTWVARALLGVQAVEAALVAYIALALDERAGAAARKAATLLGPRGGRALQSIIEDWNALGKGPNIGDRLRWLKHERSWLVHRGSLQSQVASKDVAGLLPLIRRLQELSEGAGRLAEDIHRLLRARLAETGWSAHEIRRRTEDVVNAWLAA